MHTVTSIPLNYYLILSALLFTIGATGVLIKRNPIQIFMCVELMLNAVNLTFIAFSRYQDNMSGQLMVIFVLAVAAAEVAVGLGIIVSIFRARTNINIDDMDQMRANRARFKECLFRWTISLTLG